MLRGIIVWMLAGAFGLAVCGYTWAETAAQRRAAAQNQTNTNTTKTKHKKKKKHHGLSANKSTVHVSVHNSKGKPARKATIIAKSGHHRVVKRGSHATVHIAGAKSGIKISAHNKSRAHGSAKTSSKGGSVTIKLHGGRHTSSAAVTTGKHHHRHHKHQSKNLGTSSSALRHHHAKTSSTAAPAVKASPAAAPGSK